MAISLGNKKISKIFYEDKEIKEIFAGKELIYSTFKNLEWFDTLGFTEFTEGTSNSIERTKEEIEPLTPLYIYANLRYTLENKNPIKYNDESFPYSLTPTFVFNYITPTSGITVNLRELELTNSYKWETTILKEDLTKEPENSYTSTLFFAMPRNPDISYYIDGYFEFRRENKNGELLGLYPLKNTLIENILLED